MHQARTPVPGGFGLTSPAGLLAYRRPYRIDRTSRFGLHRQPSHLR